MIALNNVTTSNAYTTANRREQPGTVRVNLEVFNAACFLQLDRDDRTPSDEEYKAPGRYSFERRCSAARVRSAVAGAPAQVTLTLLTAADLP